MKKTFYLADVPENLTVLQYIQSVSDLSAVGQNCKPKTKKQFFEFDCPVLPETLIDSFLKIKSEHGLKGWRSHLGESKIYTGISLTYNPQHQDRSDTFFSTLGSEKITNIESINNGQGRYENLKNSYYDTYSFVKIHADIQKYFGNLLAKSNLSLIRSRISQIDGGNVISTSPNFGWHKDEFVFHNLRVNIPLITSKEYFLEARGRDENSHELNLDTHLQVGKSYSWNTRILHRVYAKCQTAQPRVHMVLGYCPWFNFDTDNQAWIRNDYYGLHPFEMIEMGLIFKSLPNT